MLRLASVPSSCSFVCLRLLNLSCLIPLSLLHLKMNILSNFNLVKRKEKSKNFFCNCRMRCFAAKSDSVLHLGLFVNILYQRLGEK